MFDLELDVDYECPMHYAPVPCRICAEAAVINARELDKLVAVLQRKNSSNAAKLSEEQVGEIRERLEEGESHASIADAFGIGRSTVSNIATGRTWAPTKAIARVPTCY